MPITLFDGLLIGLMLVSGILAMIRGFSREVLSVASWAAAAVAAFYFYKTFSPFVGQYTVSFTSSEVVADVIAGAGIFLITLIVVSLITMRIADFIVDSRIGALDRTLGFVFGAARGALLVIVGLLFFNSLSPDKQPGWIANAKSKPLLESLGDNIVQMLPEDLMERIKSGNSTDGGEEKAT